MSSRSGGATSQKIELTEAEKELYMGDGFSEGKLAGSNGVNGDRNGEENIQTPTTGQMIGKRSRRYLTYFCRDFKFCV